MDTAVTSSQQVFEISAGDMAFFIVIYGCLAFVFALNGAISFTRRGEAALRGAWLGAVFAFMLWGLLVITVAMVK